MHTKYLISLLCLGREVCWEDKARNTWRNSKLRVVEISKSPPFSQHAFLSVKRSIETSLCD